MWTTFFDMASGGKNKLPWEHIYIESRSKEAAVAYFKDRFQRDPAHVTCQCSGNDYAIYDHGDLAHATGYERNARYDEEAQHYVEEPDRRFNNKKKLVSVKEYLTDPKCLFIFKKESGLE